MPVVGLNKVFREINQSKQRYRLLKGSAGSGKSVNIAYDFILKLSDEKYKGANLLVVRNTEKSNRVSTFAELSAAVYKLGLSKHWKITTSPLEMTCFTTGNRIIFCGFNNEAAREKVKSISFTEGKLTWIWVEEATQLKEADIEILDDRLRGRLDTINPNLYYQITFTFNPVSAHHWIKRKYFDTVSPDIITHHSTYLDNRFLDDGFHRRMEMRKAQDKEGYRVYGLGEWGETEGLILTNYNIEDIDVDYSNYDSTVLAQDFGFNHANCILDVGFKDGEIYILQELYLHDKDTAEIVELANSMGLPKNHMMYCDSANPDKIKSWQKAGYRAVAVSKENHSVAAQIDYLKQHKIHINSTCINTIKEIQQWKWQKDDKQGIYIDKPVEIFDDAMAALRYSIEPFRKRKTTFAAIPIPY